MIITHKKSDMIPFEKLSCGCVFKDKHSNICMKIDYVECNGGFEYNMVYLCDGSLSYIEDEENVEKVRHELVIDSI